MLSSTECRALAAEKIAQAEREPEIESDFGLPLKRGSFLQLKWHG